MRTDSTPWNRNGLPHVGVCRAFLVSLVAMSGASALAGDVWRQGSVLAFTEPVIVRTSLTIEPGVIATFSNGAFLAVASGATLDVQGSALQPVRLGPTEDSDAWNGVRFEPGSDGTVRHLDVRGSRSTCVQIVDASPLLEHCRIGNSEDDGSLGLVLFSGVIVTGSDAHPTIRRCVIESVRGLSKPAATQGTDGPNGPAGTNGTIFSTNGGPGGTGSDGGAGANGAVGGSAFGVAVLDGASITLESNVIRDIVGGDGGDGGTGGDGGVGGAGGQGFNGSFAGDGGNGGIGGQGGIGGNGGAGGSAIAVFLSDPGASLVVAGNAIFGVQAGRGGDGGNGGVGGDGGAGGAGGTCPLGCFSPGDGGDGGDARAGGAAGAAGASGVTRAISLQLPSRAITLDTTNNSLALVIPPNEAAAGSGGEGGSAGAGGLGGAGWAGGAPGDDGADGDGASSPVAIAIGVSVVGPNVVASTRNHAAQLAVAGTAPAAHFRALQGATMTVDGSCVAGHSTLAIGDVSFGSAVLEADPLFADPPLVVATPNDCCEPTGKSGCSDNACVANVCGADASCCSLQWDEECVEYAEVLCPWLCGDPLADVSLALADGSPAIDLGTNDAVPAFLTTDLADAHRITDGDGDAIAVVDAGAYESSAVTCGPDLTCDGRVDGADLAAILGSWGPCPAPCAADLDASGTVDGADLAIVLASWAQ